jgi:hypothetical protein
MTLYIEILCQLLVRWKLFKDKSSGTDYKSQVILFWLFACTERAET